MPPLRTSRSGVRVPFSAPCLGNLVSKAFFFCFLFFYFECRKKDCLFHKLGFVGMFKYEKCKLCPCINCKLCGCIIHNTTIFCSKRQCHFLYHILAHSRRGEHCSPVKKCDTYGIFVLFADL